MLEIIRRQAEFQEKYASTNGNVMFMALVEEIGEFVASTGYHDWKVSEVDKQNMIVELVDIVIFAMNCIYYEGSDTHGVADLTIDDDIDLTRSIIRSLGEGNFSEIVATIIHVYPEVMEIITGKQALNVLRQQHGYKDGTYNKLWSGKEDNRYLNEVMTKHDDFDSIFIALTELFYKHR